ncbi:MAG: hypothetical protein P8Z38_11090 [Robiginitalea sp.]
MVRKLILLVGFLTFGFAQAQDMPLEYRFGEKYKDRFKYSNLLTFTETTSGEKILVRAYYTGILLRPKGYLIERYNQELELIDEYNYKFRDGDFVHGFVANGLVNLIFLTYNQEKLVYEYTVHQSPVGAYNFTVKSLLIIAAEQVDQPLDKNYFNRNFKSGFTTTILADPDARTFSISILRKHKKILQHRVLVFNNQLRKILDVDFSAPSEEKNYAFEEMAVSPDLSSVYLVGKAYFKKRKFKGGERRYQYELFRLSSTGIQALIFDEPGKFSEAIKPLWRDGKLVCAGFYADRKDNRYNGLQYFMVNPQTLSVLKRKYHPFSEQFMFDKFGNQTDRPIKNLVFKGAHFTEDGSLLFNAEEFFVTESMQSNASGGRVRIERHHHNDIVSVKLDPQGELVWARNINKTEVTQGDSAYTSYSSYTSDGQTYFFICSSAEEPQVINNQRVLFKQGFSRRRNVFVIRLDSGGEMSYEKVMDASEARLPLMVSKPLVNNEEDRLLFYAKQGSRKQLVSIAVRGESILAE